MVEKRNKFRRRYVPTARFPQHTKNGEFVLSERRTLPTRRIDDIEVEKLSCQDLIAGLC